MNIQTNAFGQVLTIVFKNKSRGNEMVVWVCENKAAYDAGLAKLSAMPHVEVMQNGGTHVELDNR